ncbi:hypothetical protein Pmani_025507 [Petrolisthes manimaculis]|uniref:Uncharacterized protein n=1 Tax=Petrolisthes manimaculis TaxID=1843537 RepID=A0AAE1P7T1_9EUCA|nr:hypothetical protein Pmani_025507 [Petrolisthes manimaculis]
MKASQLLHNTNNTSVYSVLARPTSPIPILQPSDIPHPHPPTIRHPPSPSSNHQTSPIPILQPSDIPYPHSPTTSQTDPQQTPNLRNHCCEMDGEPTYTRHPALSIRVLVQSTAVKWIS